jgi:cytochrome P450
MHAKYGPIVRINPFELHIQDSEFYDTLYSAGGISRKRDKWSWDTLGAAGVQDSTLSTIEHDLHRMRRSAIAPFFSSANVRKLEPVIQAKVGMLFRRLLEFKDGKEKVVINLSHAFSAFTNGAHLIIFPC